MPTSSAKDMEKPARTTSVSETFKYPNIVDLSMNSKRIWGDAQNPKNANWFIQEKIDGSQLTVMVNPAYAAVRGDPDTKIEPLLFFNKGTPVAYTNKTFLKAIVMLTFLARNAAPENNFDPRFVYHGEAVCSARHNVVQYDRVPRHYFIIYDIVDESGDWFSPSAMGVEAARLGMEFAPILFWSSEGAAEFASPYTECQVLINRIVGGKCKSILGGIPEGVVLKHPQFVNEKGRTIAMKLKYVAPTFREAREIKSKGEQATPESAVQAIGQAYALSARWLKAEQHLRDAGKLKGDASDATRIKEEADNDLERERGDEIAAFLRAELLPFIKRASRNGFDEWYAEHLRNLKEREAEELKATVGPKS